MRKRDIIRFQDRYLFEQMKVGDVLVINSEHSISNNNLQCRIYPIARKLGIKVITWSVPSGIEVKRIV